jgi:acyl carrier protein
MSADGAMGVDGTASVAGVSAIFRRVLETTDITAESDFFALGGDSLLATRILSAVARTYGVELSFDDFVAAPTPGSLVEKIASLPR